MSLDLYLVNPGKCPHCGGTLVRDDTLGIVVAKHNSQSDSDVA